MHGLLRFAIGSLCLLLATLCFEKEFQAQAAETGSRGARIEDRKPAKAEAAEVASSFVSLMGTVSVKNKEVSIVVKDAREANGVGSAKYQGKSLIAVGPLLRRLQRMNKKEVNVRGKVTGDTIKVIAVNVKNASNSEPRAKSALGAIPAIGSPIGAVGKSDAGVGKPSSGRTAPSTNSRVRSSHPRAK